MLKLRTVLHKRINKQGFTLAELLVVVAIIAILVAVSIPIFSGKLTEARRSVDKANFRAARAAAVTEYLNTEAYGYQYYDADKGILVKNPADIEPYNQVKQGKVLPKTGIVQVAVFSTSDRKHL
ncbi:MAG: prepilin-type N-terminal cleavage/methylation domain-containing protein, partial [Anaerovoracaceae bacterium]